MMSSDLETAKEKISEWRKNKRPGERMPEALWQIAVELCKVHPIGRVHSSLCVGYKGLKVRVGGRTSHLRFPKRKNSFAVVELTKPTPVSTQIEVIRADGARLCMQLHTLNPCLVMDHFLGGAK